MRSGTSGEVGGKISYVDHQIAKQPTSNGADGSGLRELPLNGGVGSRMDWGDQCHVHGQILCSGLSAHEVPQMSMPRGCRCASGKWRLPSNTVRRKGGALSWSIKV